METGRTTRPTAMESTTILTTEPNMRATGKMIYSTDLVKRAGLTMPSTKESTSTAGSMEKVNSTGMMAPPTPVNSKTTTSKAMEFMNGLMVESSLDSGKPT